MGAFGKDGIEALLLADDPDAEFLFVLFAHLSDRIVSEQARLEGCGRLEKHSGEGGAEKAQEAKAGKDSESAPTQTGEEIPPGPDSPLGFRRFFAFVFRHRRLPFDPADHGAPDNEEQSAEHQRQPDRSEYKREARP